MNQIEQDFQIDQKQIFFRELLFHIIKDQKIDLEFLKLKNEKFLGVFNYLFQDLYEKVIWKKEINLDFVAQHFGVIPIENRKSQSEIVQQLESIYCNESLTNILTKYQNNLESGSKLHFTKLVKELHEVDLNMTPLRAVSSHDDDAMLPMLLKIVGGKKYINFGDDNDPDQDIAAWNSLQLAPGQLIGILMPTKHGKSFAMTHLHALALKAGYGVDHGNYEMTRDEFWPRLYTALGYYPLDAYEECSIQKIQGFYYKYKELYPVSWIQTQEDCRPNLLQVEKILEKSSNLFFFLDYITLLNESFDPVASKVARDLKALAVRYNKIIVTAFNTNDEGRQYDKPPEISHIKWCKTLADDFDKIISGISKIDPSNADERYTEFVSKLIRQKAWVNWTVKENRNLGLWKLRSLTVNNKRLVTNDVK